MRMYPNAYDVFHNGSIVSWKENIEQPCSACEIDFSSITSTSEPSSQCTLGNEDGPFKNELVETTILSKSAPIIDNPEGLCEDIFSNQYTSTNVISDVGVSSDKITWKEAEESFCTIAKEEEAPVNDSSDDGDDDEDGSDMGTTGIVAGAIVAMGLIATRLM